MEISDAERQRLLRLASQARRHAYAPYSKYPVGAAVLAGSGATYAGVNVENAAYPNGMCAERAAIFAAVTAGEREIRAVAVVTENGGTPCGSCRQVVSEFGPAARILLADQEGNLILDASLDDLLPRAFGRRDLDRDG